jgi:hypothetical protein
MSWLWFLPLAATLLACAALARALRLVATESRAVRESAARLVPIAREVQDATATVREYGTTVANAARRYTPRDGQRRRR